MQQELIAIKNFTRGYPQSGQQIFYDFNLSLHKGDFCFVMGKSGVGKTTLIKFLTRQLQAPKGAIFYKNLDLHSMNHREVQDYRKKIGIVFQDYKLLDWKTVGANVEQACEIHHLNAQESTLRSKKILESLGIVEKYNAMPKVLSGGEKQRVALARALVMQPEFLIADEATGNLDEKASLQVMDAFAKLNKQGHTIICITHDSRLPAYVKQQGCGINIITL